MTENEIYMTVITCIIVMTKVIFTCKISFWQIIYVKKKCKKMFAMIVFWNKLVSFWSHIRCVIIITYSLHTTSHVKFVIWILKLD